MLILWLGLFAASLLPPPTFQQKNPEIRNGTQESSILNKLVGELKPRSISEITYDDNGKAHVRKILSPPPPSSGFFESSSIDEEDFGKNESQIGALYLDENGQAQLRRFSSSPSYFRWSSSKKSEGGAGVAQKALIHRKVNIESATLYRFKQKNALRPVVQEILVTYPPVSQSFVYDFDNISCLFNSSDSDLVVVPPKPPLLFEVVPSKPPQALETVPSDVRVVLPADTALLPSLPTISSLDNLPKRVHPIFPNGFIESPKIPQQQQQHFVGVPIKPQFGYVQTPVDNVLGHQKNLAIPKPTPDLLLPKFDNLPKRVRPDFKPQNNPTGAFPLETPPPPPPKVFENVQQQTPASTQLLESANQKPQHGFENVDFDVQKLSVSSPDLLWPKWNGLPKRLQSNGDHHGNPLGFSGYVHKPNSVEIDVSSSSSANYLTPASTQLLSNGGHHQTQSNTAQNGEMDVSSSSTYVDQQHVSPHQQNVAQNYFGNIVVPASTQILANHQHLGNQAPQTPNQHYLNVVDLQKLGVSWDNLPKRVKANFGDKIDVALDASYNYGQTPASTSKPGGVDVGIKASDSYFGVLPKRVQPGFINRSNGGFATGDFISVGYAQTPASTQLLTGTIVRDKNFDQNPKSVDFAPKNSQTQNSVSFDNAQQLIQTPSSTQLLGNVVGSFSNHQNSVGVSTTPTWSVLPKRVNHNFGVDVSSSLNYGQTPASTQLLQNHNDHHGQQNVFFVPTANVFPKRVQSGFVEKTNGGFASNDFFSVGYAQVPASTKLLGDSLVSHQNINQDTKNVDPVPKKDQTHNSVSFENIQNNNGVLASDFLVPAWSVLPKRINHTFGVDVSSSLNYGQSPASTHLLQNHDDHHDQQNVFFVPATNVLPKKVQSGYVDETNGDFVPASTKLLGDSLVHHQNFDQYTKNVSNVPKNTQTQNSDSFENIQTVQNKNGVLASEFFVPNLGVLPKRVNPGFSTNRVEIDSSSSFNYGQTPASTQFLQNHDHQNSLDVFSVSPANVLPKRVQSGFVNKNDGLMVNNFASLDYPHTPASTKFLDGTFVRHQQLNQGTKKFEITPANAQTQNGASFENVQLYKNIDQAQFLQNNRGHQNSQDVLPKKVQSGFVHKNDDFAYSGYAQTPASTLSLGGTTVQHQNIDNVQSKNVASTQIIDSHVQSQNFLNLPKRVNPNFNVLPQKVFVEDSFNNFNQPKSPPNTNVVSYWDVLPKKVHSSGFFTTSSPVDGGYAQTPPSAHFIGSNSDQQNRVSSSSWGYFPKNSQNSQKINEGLAVGGTFSNVLASGYAQTPASTNFLGSAQSYQQNVQVVPKHHQNVDNVETLPQNIQVEKVDVESSNAQTPSSTQLYLNQFDFNGNLPKRVQNQKFNNHGSVFGGGVSLQGFATSTNPPASTNVLSNSVIQPDSFQTSPKSNLPKRVQPFYIYQEGENTNLTPSSNHFYEVQNSLVGQTRTPASTQVLQNENSINRNGGFSQNFHQESSGVQTSQQSPVIVLEQSPASTQVFQNELSQTPLVSSDDRQNKNHGVYVDFSSSSLLVPFKNVGTSLVQTPPSTHFLQKNPNTPQNGVLLNSFPKKVDNDQKGTHSTYTPVGTTLLPTTKLYESQRVEAPPHISGNPQNTLFESALLPKNTEPLKVDVVVENAGRSGVLRPTEENLPEKVQNFDKPSNAVDQKLVPNIGQIEETTSPQTVVTEVTSEVPSDVSIVVPPSTGLLEQKPSIINDNETQNADQVSAEIERALANFGRRINHSNTSESEEAEMGVLVPNNNYDVKKVVVYKKDPETPESAQKVRVVKVRPLPKNYQKQTMLESSTNSDAKFGTAPSGTYRLVGDEIVVPNDESSAPILKKQKDVQGSSTSEENQLLTTEPHRNGDVISPAGTVPFTGLLSSSFDKIPALRFSPFSDNGFSVENTPKSAHFVANVKNSDGNVQNDQKIVEDSRKNEKHPSESKD